MEADGLQRFLEEEVWPQLPPDVRGQPMTKAEREEILGYGPDGV
jgi:antitoxin VapB